MRFKSWTMIPVVMLFVAALAPLTALAQDDFFDGLNRTEAAASRTPAADPGALTNDDQQLLKLLDGAIGDALAVLKERSKDKKGRTFLDAGYEAYETRMTSTDHLLLAGTLYQNSFKGFSTNKTGDHNFAFDPKTAQELRKPVVYLEALAKHAGPASKRLVALYTHLVQTASSSRIKGSEREWFKIPPAGASAARGHHASFLALRQFTNLSRTARRALEVPADVQQQLQNTLEFCQTALGLSETGSEVDSARIDSALAIARRGTNVVLARLPGVSAQDSQYTLKPGLAATLQKLAPDPKARDTMQQRVRLAAWKTVGPLLGTFVVKNGVILVRREAIAQVGNLALQTGANIRGMMFVLQRL